ncbi:MAG: hypothetical protein QM725_09470 [Lacibacter sp.]
MNANIAPEIRDVIEALHYRPSVSVIQPFDTKMGLKAELAYSLKIALDKAEQELMNNYSSSIALPVLNKLKSIIAELKPEFQKHKKSIAIFVSPVFDKVLYLDVPVEQKVIVDDSFEIRDLIYSKKQLHKYLLLILSSKESKLFLGNSEEFAKIILDRPASAEAYIHDTPERVTNFSDVDDRREMILEKFLHQIDLALEEVLNKYPLPLFVMGAERTNGKFRHLTKHIKQVAVFINGNYEDHSFAELKQIMKPYVEKWKDEKQKELLQKIDEAAGKKKLAKGMNEVWRDAMLNKGQLLLVEKNYMYAAQLSGNDDVLYKVELPAGNTNYIKDAVDDVIEKVISNGGDVEFVDEGLLKDFGHIALVNYY